MTKDELQKKATELLEFFESKDDGYFADHRKMYEVNVKRYNDYVNTDDLIKTYPKRYQKALRDLFTEEHQNNLHWHWLEYESEYLCDVLKSHGKVIGSEGEELEAFNMLDEKWLDFYGRSGGHFCFDIDNDLSDIEAVIEWQEPLGRDYPEEMTTKEAKAIIADAEKKRKAVLYVKNWVKSFNDGLDFKEELKFRIDEKIEELKAEEKTAREERKEIARKAKASANDSIRLVDLIHAKNQTIARNAQSIVKALPEKIVFKVTGRAEGDPAWYQLGFTSDPRAWLRNANGWKKDQLKFELQ